MEEDSTLVELVAFPEALIAILTAARYPAPSPDDKPRSFTPRVTEAAYLLFHWPWSVQTSPREILDSHSLFSLN